MKCSKNRLAVIVFIVTVLLLTGWAPWQRVPDLVDIDGPFIDLAGSVGDSIGNALQVYESENAANAPTPVPAVVPVLQPTPTPAVPSDITPTPVPAQDPARIIRIIVGTEPAAGPDADGGEKYIIGNTVFDEAGRVLSYIRQQPVVIFSRSRQSNIKLVWNCAVNARCAGIFCPSFSMRVATSPTRFMFPPRLGTTSLNIPARPPSK